MLLSSGAELSQKEELKIHKTCVAEVLAEERNSRGAARPEAEAEAEDVGAEAGQQLKPNYVNAPVGREWSIDCSGLPEGATLPGNINNPATDSAAE